MKSFFKNVISSCLGTLLALGLLVLVGFIIIKSYTKSAKLNQAGILHIPIEGTINDYASAGLDLYNLNFTPTSLTLWELRNKINAASDDDEIKAIFLEFKNGVLSQQMVSEISTLLIQFKQTGKKIYAYSNYYEQNAYLLSTFSDSIFLNPNGGIALTGYGVYSPFFDQILSKWDIDINIFYAGKYKSSTEPYRLDSFSEENEEQLRAYLSQLHDNLYAWIGDNRSASRETISDFLEQNRVYDSDYVKANRLVDEVMYRDQVMGLMDSLYGEDKLVTFNSYEYKRANRSDEVALVFAQGEILWSASGTSGITHDQYSKIFEKIKENKAIETVILRLDSPGGNGYTSDLLYREVALLKEAGKTVYASLGTYATSGAYYIASACDSIFATDNTMTGSIGVYIMLPTFNEFIENHLEISLDTVKTAENAISYSPLIGLTEKQEKSLKLQAENLYELFLKRVAEGRGKSVAEINKIAQGRIWTGKDAMKIGLVDDLLTLDEVIARYSGSEAPLIYPEQKVSIPAELLKNNLDKFAKTQISEIKWLEMKVVEFQKLIENPSPYMRIPPFVNVTNQ